MRKSDDKIIYVLNTSLPTESFKGNMDPVAKCRDLNAGLLTGYNERTAFIKTCILETAQVVKKAKALKDANEGDPTIHKQFKNEQRKVRFLYLLAIDYNYLQSAQIVSFSCGYFNRR